MPGPDSHVNEKDTRRMGAPTRLAEVWARAAASLGGGGAARAESLELIAAVLDRSATALRMDLDSDLTKAQVKQVYAGIARLAEDEPLAYILGYAYFWGLKISLGSGVLIPRPDTETLIACALAMLPLFFRGDINGDENGGDSGDSAIYGDGACARTKKLRILEPCTGSGCVTKALLYESNAGRLPDLEVTATDNSDAALYWAHLNLQDEMRSGRCRVEKADIWPRSVQNPPFSLECDSAEKQLAFDVLIANPPYVADEEFPDLDASVRRFEPIEALRASGHGLDYYRRFLDEGGEWLKPGALLLLEHGWRQRAALESLCAAHADFEWLGSYQDLAGRDRVAALRYSPAAHDCETMAKPVAAQNRIAGTAACPAKPLPCRYETGDVLTFRKKHPCGANEWQLIQVAADLKLRCLCCGRIITMTRTECEKRIKSVRPGVATEQTSP